MSQTQKKPNLRRKDSIPEEDQTDSRDEAADYIEDMWPATLGEISEESGYSVSHIHNTLNLYFERYTDDNNGSNNRSSGSDGSNGSNDSQGRSSARNEQQGQQYGQQHEVPQQVRDKRHEVDIPEIYLDSPQMLQAYLHGWGDGYIEGRSDCLDQQENGDNGSDE